MIIFTRTACLGGWITKAKFGTKNTYYNQQKVRADIFLDYVNKKTKNVPRNILQQNLKRKDMGGIYSQFEKLHWLKVGKKPAFFIIDNYSELVDKRFKHPDGWEFTGEYGNFESTFIKNFEDKGLLDDVYNSYDNLFRYIKDKWNVPIIYFHFPTTFDKREKYINQGQKITETMELLAPKYNIQNIHADPDKIEQRDSEVYHMSDKTVLNMVSKIKCDI